MRTTVVCTLILFLVGEGFLYGGDIAGPYGSFPKLHGSYLGQNPPELTPKVFCPGFLKPPEGFHSTVTFTPDMKEAYWTSQGTHTYRSKLENGVWTRPSEIIFDSIYGVGEVAWAPDGSKLFLLSRRPPASGDAARERIWYCDADTGILSEPLPVGNAVNDHPTHWLFSVAANGNIYFTSEIDGAGGGQDIYVAPWDGHRFSAPFDLGPQINSDVRDFTPFIAPDESYLIFARSVSEENNRSDLFISFKDPDGSWSQAVNMGDTVNSLHNEVCPVVTPDGKYLFFTRISGEINEVFWVSSAVIDSLKAKR